jgi:oligopeptide transport system ATP-binding protein
MIDKKINGSAVDLPANDEARSIIGERISRQDPVSRQISDDILTVRDLKMYFPVTKGFLKRKVADVKAVDGVSFAIKKGQTLGIVGESGSGKSTVGKCVMRDILPTGGSIVYNGIELTRQKPQQLRQVHRQLQMITQDPFASLDPRMKVSESILEGVRIQKMVKSTAEEKDLVGQMLEMVGLNPKFADRFPHEFSGGQRQRISIARALALSPSFIICDEIVSALDVSIQAQIVNLMIHIQQELNISYIFIGHDLSVVRHISNQVAVMYLGKFMELTSSDDLYEHPLHPYTQALISAAPIPNPTADSQRERILLEGEVPSPIDPPKGCNFCTRCKYADKRCMEEEPEFKDMGGGHFVACHRVSGN